MADISLKVVEDTMKADFRAGGQGSKSFTKLLITAVNASIGRINRQTKFATPTTTAIATINNMTGTVGLDNEYLDILLDLVGLRMAALGQRPAKGKDKKYEVAALTIDDRVDDIRQDFLNVAVKADSSDTSDFIGLGGLG